MGLFHVALFLVSFTHPPHRSPHLKPVRPESPHDRPGPLPPARKRRKRKHQSARPIPNRVHVHQRRCAGYWPLRLRRRRRRRGNPAAFTPGRSRRSRLRRRCDPATFAAGRRRQGGSLNAAAATAAAAAVVIAAVIFQSAASSRRLGRGLAALSCLRCCGAVGERSPKQETRTGNLAGLGL